MEKSFQYYTAERKNLFSLIESLSFDKDVNKAEIKKYHIRSKLLCEVSKQCGYLYTIIHQKPIPLEIYPDSSMDNETMKNIFIQSNISSLNGSFLATEKLLDDNQISENFCKKLKTEIAASYEKLEVSESDSDSDPDSDDSYGTYIYDF